MRVVLEIMGHAVEFFPGKKQHLEVDLPEPKSIRDILSFIGVKNELVMYAMSGGKRVTKDYVPHDGEELVLFTPPAGG